MPSTYSPDLRIELIANGDQSGSWGNTTNTNLGTLIEDAISGTATVTTASANYALTAYNGIADESRCAAVVLNTSTGANFAVYVPPVTKLYAVKNNSAYVATVYCSTVLGNTTAAGTGVAIPAGKSMLLRSDGTNVVEQLSQVVGDFGIGGAASIVGALSVGGAASVTGNITVTGTGAFTGDVTVPTQTAGDSSTKAATTAFVGSAITTATAPLAPLASPALTGTPTAPTAAQGTNNTQIATTAFVQANGVPTAMVMPFASSTAPTGWLECNGNAVSRTTYAALFAIVGTTYGAGNGSTTFNLPDMRGNFMRGWDNGAGIDTGRAIGSTQESTGIPLGTAIGYPNSGQAPTGWGTGNINVEAALNSVSISPAGGGISTFGGVAPTNCSAYRIRPRNVAMMYCIKT